MTKVNHCGVVIATTQIYEYKGLVLSSVANLVHLCGEDVGSNPAWTVSGH